jgi:ribosomal protein S17
MSTVPSLLLIAVLSCPAVFVPAQQTDKTSDPPGLELVKLEVSVIRAPALDEQPPPRSDLGSLQTRADATAPRENNRMEGATPRYDRQGQVIRPPDRATESKGGDTGLPKDLNSNKYRFIASVVVRNTGEKTIKAVCWDYVLTSTRTNKELRRYDFRHKKKIAPGETVTLVQEVKPSSAARRVEITRIEYADGSSWTRAQDSKPRVASGAQGGDR